MRVADVRVDHSNIADAGPGGVLVHLLRAQFDVDGRTLTFRQDDVVDYHAAAESVEAEEIEVQRRDGADLDARKVNGYGAALAMVADRAGRRDAEDGDAIAEVSGAVRLDVEECVGIV